MLSFHPPNVDVHLPVINFEKVFSFTSHLLGILRASVRSNKQYNIHQFKCPFGTG